LGYFTLNNSTCTWDNDGTTQPAAEKVTVGILLLSTPLLVLGIMMDFHVTEKKLLGYFYFQQFNLLLGIMMEPHKPAAPEKTNCWVYFQHLYFVRGIMMVQLNLQHQRKELLGYFYFQQFYLYLG
jgi:hypothetical protein